MNDSVEMSVVVPVRYAPQTIARTMKELLERDGLEVIAVVSTDDPTCLLLHQVKQQHPELVLVEVSGRWSVPQLRARGLREAQGRLIAITEDHCSFSESWPAALAPALEDPQIGAAGGPVINGRRDRLLDWAIFLSRYARFTPPATRGPTEALPGNSVCYRREVLDSFLPELMDGFREHEFHEHLLAQGMKLWLDPDARVAHQKPYRFLSYCVLRFCHGQCFAGMRRRTMGFWKLQSRILISPIVPLVLSARTARTVWAKGVFRGKWLAAAPILFVFHLAWALGELSGYFFGPGEACSRTD